jgi:ABC-type transporter Mla subunit MlaD
VIQANLWTRLGSLIKPFTRDDDLPELAKVDVLLPAGDSAADSPLRGLFRGRRDEVLTRMQTGYDKILDLVESIQDHLARQDEHGEKVVGSLNDLARGVHHLPESTRRHTDALSKAAAQVEVSNSHAQVMIGVLRVWPSATAAQRQALEAIGDHLRSSAEATRDLSERLRTLDQTVSTLGQAAGEQVRALREMQRSARQQEVQFVQLLTAQTRRCAILLGVGTAASVLVLFALATLLK